MMWWKARKVNLQLKKVETIDIGEISAPQRKEVKKLEKRDIYEEEYVAPAPVKEVKPKSVPTTTAPVITPQAEQPKKIYSAIKK